MAVIALNNTNYFLSGKNLLVTEKPPATPTHGILTKAPGNLQEIVAWGEGNNLPKLIRDQAYKIPLIPRAIMFHVNMVAGARVVPVTYDYDDDGNEIRRVVKDPEILTYLRSTEFRKYKVESASDLFWFQNIFPELILSKDRKKILIMSPNEAMFCRWGVQNENGTCDYLYHNANWPNARISDTKTTTKIRTIDPYAYNVAEAVREETAHYKFIYPSSYPSPGNLFYQTAFWDGIRQSKYLDFLEQIPEVKAKIIQNKMKPAYHINIPMIHWERWFGKAWFDADAAKRKEMKAAYLADLEAMFTPNGNAGAAFATEYGSASNDQRIAEKWEIHAIEDNSPDGSYIQDNIDATVQLLCALGIDAALIGYSSKETGTRNGGSDKLQALQIYIETIEPFRDVILEPLRFKAQFDGWSAKYPGLDFAWSYPNLDRLTQKQNPPKSEPKTVEK